LPKIDKITICKVSAICLALALIFVMKFDSVASTMGNFLIVNDAPQKSDMIIVLAGVSGDRIRYATKLYHLGYADTVLLSSGSSYMT
jgi:hypothetical protein